MTLQELQEEIKAMREEDPGRVFIDDREKVEAAAIEEQKKKALLKYTAAQDQKKIEQYDPQKNNTLYYINNLFEKDLKEEAAATLKTGFNYFDKITGGIKPGLYIIGAAPSIGKTTFCLQLADQIAAQNKKVLYFTLEQTRRDLIIKSLNRFTNERTTRENLITDPEARKEAAEKYKEVVKDNIQIFDGTNARKYNEIRDYIIYNIESKPLVIIDYLQIIDPEKSKGSLKEDIKAMASDLASIAHNNEITIILISSFSRSNYYMPANLGAFKESGDIEYSADLLITMQLDIFDNDFIEKETAAQIMQTEKAKEEDPRQIVLKIIKNRSGQTGRTYFEYYTSKDLFREITEDFNF